ncbi:MAG TPA: hypothetical protein VEZ40_15145 [Pyrinomonadaceae bacterium]|nr:hypothetical protein [Pyrinomonadaceae bacterium]
MSTKTALDVTDEPLREQIVRKIVKLGCACAPDLAGEIGIGKRADDLIPTLHALVDEGVLRRRAHDPNDHHKSDDEYQIVYELAG